MRKCVREPQLMEATVADPELVVVLARFPALDGAFSASETLVVWTPEFVRIYVTMRGN